MEALILAAGRGSRMRPFTDWIPKPLLPINGEAVLLQSLRTLKESGFKKVVITVGYLKEEVIDFVEKRKPTALEIDFAYQESLSGSAEAIRVALERIENDFLTLAGDTVFPLSEIKKVVEIFQKGDFEAVVGLKMAKREELKEKSSTLINREGLLLKVIEKPEPGSELSPVSVAPIYYFRREAISQYLKQLEPNEKGVYELATALQNLIDDGGKVKGVFLKETKDLTFPMDLLKHNFSYLEAILCGK